MAQPAQIHNQTSLDGDFDADLDCSSASNIRRTKRRRADNERLNWASLEGAGEIDYKSTDSARSNMYDDNSDFTDEAPESKDHSYASYSRIGSGSSIQRVRHTTVYDAVSSSHASADEVLASRVSGLHYTLSEEYSKAAEQLLPSSVRADLMRTE